MKTIFKNAHLFDPKSGLDNLGWILVEDGRIVEVKTGGTAPTGGDVTDLQGLTLTPGFIDLHVHLREPGEEHKENIETGTKAAAAGGYTTVCVMPNTKTVNDSAMITKLIMDRAKKVGAVRVHPIGAISRGLEGKEMSEYDAMIKAGCVAMSDDGKCVMDSLLARKAMEYFKDFDIPYIEHCEDHRLSAGGAMNEGFLALKMGVPGIPHAAEDVMVARDIALARQTGARVHLAHLSSRHSVESLRAARREGLRVSGEVTPHHLVLTEGALKNWDANFKMAPPLRTEEDRKALIRAVEDGTINSIATDHAPHTEGDKRQEFCCASNGVIGLETAFAVCMTVVKTGDLSFRRLIETLTSGPAEIMGFRDRGVLKTGTVADFAVLDREAVWTIDKESLLSKSRNCPFHGWKVQGRIEKTVVAGKVVYER